MKSVLKSSVYDMIETNKQKNHIGSAMAGKAEIIRIIAIFSFHSNSSSYVLIIFNFMEFQRRCQSLAHHYLLSTSKSYKKIDTSLLFIYLYLCLPPCVRLYWWLQCTCCQHCYCCFPRHGSRSRTKCGK